MLVVLGIALLILAILAFVRIPDIVKYAGTALMYVPAKLGVIDMVMPKDVVALPIDKNPSSITFPSSGKYALYTGHTSPRQGSMPCIQITTICLLFTMRFSRAKLNPG